MEPIVENDVRRPRLLRRHSTKSETGNLFIFLIAIALIGAVAFTLLVGLGALPTPL